MLFRSHYSETNQRADAVHLADQFLAKKIPHLRDWNGDDYSMTDLGVQVFEHSLYDSALFDKANGNHIPMTDLIKRIARHAAAVHLFGDERADELGFLV